MGTDPSSPVWLSGIWHGVRRFQFPYPKLCPCLLLACAGYDAGLLAYLFKHRLRLHPEQDNSGYLDCIAAYKDPSSPLSAKGPITLRSPQLSGIVKGIQGVAISAGTFLWRPTILSYIILHPIHWAWAECSKRTVTADIAKENKYYYYCSKNIYTTFQQKEFTQRFTLQNNYLLLFHVYSANWLFQWPFFATPWPLYLILELCELPTYCFLDLHINYNPL